MVDVGVTAELLFSRGQDEGGFPGDTQSLDAPRISWSVYCDKNCYLTCIMGGQTPTWQVAQARADAIWRIAANTSGRTRNYPASRKAVRPTRPVREARV